MNVPRRHTGVYMNRSCYWLTIINNVNFICFCRTILKSQFLADFNGMTRFKHSLWKCKEKVVTKNIYLQMKEKNIWPVNLHWKPSRKVHGRTIYCWRLCSRLNSTDASRHANLDTPSKFLTVGYGIVLLRPSCTQTFVQLLLSQPENQSWLPYMETALKFSGMRMSCLTGSCVTWNNWWRFSDHS